MLFTSPSFLFCFLPLTLLTYFAARRFFPGGRLENAVLLFWSLLFYAWGELRYVPLLAFSIIVNYALGRALGSPTLAARPRNAAFVTGVVVNLGLLAVFKYLGFFVANLDALLAALKLTASPRLIGIPKIELPLGISFFTFHALSYLFDVERKKVPAQRSLATFALYILLFPQLVAGPIIRYHDLAAALEKRTVTLDGFSRAILRFTFGFAKKMLIANNIGLLADRLFGDSATLSCGGAWLAGIVYSLQIFFDFSGYSDMAIALGAMFGFPFPENFNYPFIAKSISEYWQRWHISLTNWLREYCYTPIAMAIVRRVEWALPSAIVITMTLSGLWHGAAWNFIIWGCYFGVIMAFEQELLRAPLKKLPAAVQHLYTLVIVILSFVLFRATSAGQCLAIVRAMFDPHRLGSFPERWLITPKTALCLGAAVLFSMPLRPALVRRWERLSARLDDGFKSRIVAGAAWTELALACLLFLAASTQVAASTYNPFIYFRF